MRPAEITSFTMINTLEGKSVLECIVKWKAFGSLIYSTLKSNDGRLRRESLNVLSQSTISSKKYRYSELASRHPLVGLAYRWRWMPRMSFEAGPAQPLVAFLTVSNKPPRPASFQGSLKKMSGEGFQLQLSYLLLSFDITDFRSFFSILCSSNSVLMRYLSCLKFSYFHTAFIFFCFENSYLVYYLITTFVYGKS